MYLAQCNDCVPNANQQCVVIYLVGKKRSRCGSCTGCKAADCQICPMCLDKPKYGGPGKKKQCCVKRKCLDLKSSVHESGPPNVQQLVKTLHATTSKLFGMVQ